MRSVRVFTLAALAAVGSGLSLHAQCYEPLTGSSIGTGDDIVLPMQALGFAFPSNGTTYTHIHPSTNGFAYLSNAGVPAPGGPNCCAGSTGVLVAGSPMVAPYWSDLNVVSGTGTVKFNALPGKAVITWENAIEFGDLVTNTFSVQLQLFASGEIDFEYDGRCAIRTAGDFVVGMSEGAAAAVPAQSDFSVVGVSATTTNYQIFNNVGATYDLGGKTVQFLPTSPGYAWVPSQCAGGHTSYGNGCYKVSSSLYEYFPTNAFDLANSGMSMVFNGGGYTVLPGFTAFVPPSISATSLALTDDSQTTVTLSSAFPFSGGSTTTLSVCSNGYISVAAAGNGTSFTPTVATMLNATNTGFWNWHDFNPSAVGSGAVKFEESGGFAYITWNGVYSYGTTNPETFQFQLELATGNVHFVWGAIGGFGNNFLVGYSPGGASQDLGSTDLSVALPSTITIAPSDLFPLTLAATTTPTPGSTVTYTTSNIPEYIPTSGLHIALNILSIGQVPAPGIDLGFIGAPGCAALVQSLDYTQSMVGATASLSVTFPLPLSVPLGLQVFSQSAALITPNSLPNGQNAFGITTSNGIATTVGAW